VNGAATTAVPPIVPESLDSGGRPLDVGTRGLMESRFRHSFSNVRVHTDARAADAARAIDAQAFTVGSDIAFANGRYDPGSHAGRRLLAHELAHVVQQHGTPIAPQRATLAPALGAHEQAADAAADVVLAGRPAPAQPRLSTQVVARQPITPPAPKAPEYILVVVEHAISGPEFCARALAQGTGRDLAEVRKLVASGEWGCHGSISTGGLSEEQAKKLTGPIKFHISGPPAQARSTEDVRDLPGVQEALASPEMQQWFKLRERYHRLHPNLRVPLFRELKLDDDLAVLHAYELLKGLDETDWSVLNREVSGVAPGWTEAEASLEAFRTSYVRREAQEARTSREWAISTADAEVDLVEEKRAVERLTGLGDLYEAIKDYESPERKGPHGADIRMVEAYYQKVMEEKLEKENFEDLSEFDDAVGRLRVVVRREAVKLTLHALKESEESLVKERERYREPKEVEALFNELGAWRRRPQDPAPLIALLNRHWLLGTSVVLRSALDANYAGLLGDMLVQNAGAQLNNVALCRTALNDHPNVVFDFNKIIELTFEQMKIGTTSVQAQLIREGRAKTDDRSWARKWLVDRLLGVLSFVPGPIGWAARATQFAFTINDIQTHFNQQAAAANAGTALASQPKTGGSTFDIIMSLLGLLPGPKPRPLLGGKPLIAKELRDAAVVVAKDEAAAEANALEQSAPKVSSDPVPPAPSVDPAPVTAEPPVGSPAVDVEPPVALKPDPLPVTTKPTVSGPTAQAEPLTDIRGVRDEHGNITIRGVPPVQPTAEAVKTAELAVTDIVNATWGDVGVRDISDLTKAPTTPGADRLFVLGHGDHAVLLEVDAKLSIQEAPVVIGDVSAFETAAKSGGKSRMELLDAALKNKSITPSEYEALSESVAGGRVLEEVHGFGAVSGISSDLRAQQVTFAQGEQFAHIEEQLATRASRDLSAEIKMTIVAPAADPRTAKAIAGQIWRDFEKEFQLKPAKAARPPKKK
jgi:hypothetical protein